MDGYESGFVKLLTLRRSVQNLGVLSGFGTVKHGDAQLDDDGTAMLFSSIYFIFLIGQEWTTHPPQALPPHEGWSPQGLY